MLKSSYVKEKTIHIIKTYNHKTTIENPFDEK